MAPPVLPGEAHEDPVAWALGHVPLHPTALIEKQGKGSASIRGEDGLVGVGLRVVGDKHRDACERSGVPSPIPHPFPDTHIFLSWPTQSKDMGLKC